MTDNPQAAEHLVFALPDHRILSLIGRDAVAFAQAQFMNDVAALPIGHWQWNGWLTPKGRVIALFALLKLDQETLSLIVSDVDPAELAAKLQRYVFRSKVKIEVAPDRFMAGSFSAARTAKACELAGDQDQGIELDVSADGGARTLRIVAEPMAQDAGAVARWAAFDLAHGLPRLGASQTEQWTPQQLSLDRLKAYSVKKGCYPGQEIVARTHFLGQAKRGLMRLRSARMHELDEVFIGSAPIGQVICAVGNEGLAVMPLQPASGPMTTDGAPCEPLPLLSGLAR